MILELKNVTCGYNKHEVVSGLSFSLSDGKALCILGPNGIGKTTIFKTILGLIRPISGEVIINGKEVNQYTDNSRAKLIAYVPQARNYSYQFSVKDVVMMGRASYISRFSSPNKTDICAVEQALDRLGIADYSGRKYSELSGGEQQIVLVARAIAQEAKFILLDEPTSNLDFYNQKKLLDIINLLTNEGVGILMVSHNPEHAFICCDDTLMISKDGSYVFGKTNDIVNGANLSKTYGIDIEVASINDKDGKIIYSCYLK